MNSYPTPALFLLLLVFIEGHKLQQNVHYIQNVSYWPSQNEYLRTEGKICLKKSP